MTLTVLHSILGYLLSFRSDIIIPCFRKFAINLWFSFLVCILSKTKSRLLCEDGFSYCGRGNTTRTCNKRFWRPPRQPWNIRPYKWQTIANLRSASATPLVTQVCICSAFSFGSRLSALRNTHNPLELHGKRMTERLPLQYSTDFVSTGSALPSRFLCVGTPA